LTPADASYAASWHEKEVIAGKLSEIVAGKKGARAVVVGTRVGRGRGGARAWDGARELVSHLQDRGWRGVIEIDPVT
jgi:hypothetical protein